MKIGPLRLPQRSPGEGSKTPRARLTAGARADRSNRLRPGYRMQPAAGELDARSRRPSAPHDHCDQRAGIESRRGGAARVVMQPRVRCHGQGVRVRTPGPGRGAPDAPGPRGQRLLRLNRARYVRREARHPGLHVGGGVPFRYTQLVRRFVSVFSSVVASRRVLRVPLRVSDVNLMQDESADTCAREDSNLRPTA